MIATILELAYMANLKSVGTPYFSPMAPFQWRRGAQCKICATASLASPQGGRMNAIRLSSLQIFLVLLSLPVVASSYYYPHLVYRMGTRGWWLTIIASDAVIYGLAWSWLVLAKAFPQGTLVGVARAGTGQIIGGVMLLPLVLPLWLSVVITLRELAVLTTASLLPHSSMGLLYLMGLVTAFYTAYLGIKGISHYAEIIMILITWPLMLVLYPIACENFKLIYLAHWWWIPDHASVIGIFELPLALTGLLALPVLLPYVDSLTHLKVGVAWALGIGSLVLLVGVAGPLGTLGPAAAEATPIPSLTFFNAAATAILFVQQLAYPIVALWVTIFVGAAAFSLWASARIIAEIFGRPRITSSLIVLTILAWAMNQALPTIVQLRQVTVLEGILTSIGLVWMVLTAILINVLARRRHRTRNPHASLS